MNNRKTITLNDNILNTAEVLPNDMRLMFYDKLMQHFLKGQDLSLNEVPDILKVALVGIMPELRKLQSKFDAGITQKKFREKEKASLCPNDRSKMKQNKANQSIEDNNIYSTFPNLIYILYKYNNSINLPHGCVRTHEKPFKQDHDTKAEVQLNKLKSKNPAMYNYFNQIVTRVNKEKGIKISGVPTTAEKILPQLSKIAEQSNLEELLISANEESSSPKVRDKIRYSISLLYNLATRLINVPPSQVKAPVQKDFTEREYTREELNSLFDTLDDIELDN